MWARRHSLAVLGALAALATVSSAEASDARPRSTVVWPEDAACGTVVDRSQDPVVHLEYAASMDDLVLDPGEIETGRRFQFFAMCRDNGPQEPLPQWITFDDVTAAGMTIPKFDPMTIMPQQVLDDAASGWPGCAERINADDARIPISAADAAVGVDWDTTGVPAGVYTIHGYTWDPTINIWSDRLGFVKVHDGDPTAAGPAVAVTTLEQILYLDEVALIEGCVDASDGATMDVYWTRSLEDDWQPYMTDEPVVGDAFAFEFDPPEGVMGESVVLRVDVTDGGMTHTGFMQELVVVLEQNNPDACTNGGGFIGEPGCADSGGEDADGSGTAGDASATSGATGDGDETGATSSADTSGMADGGDGGGGTCACRSSSGSGSGAVWLGLGLLGLAATRRRR